MATYKFGDIVKDVKQNIDRANNPYEYYVAGDHMDSRDLTIRRKGRFDTDDVGPAFTRLFKPGQVLYGSRRAYLQKVAVADFAGICANTTFVFEGKDESIFDQRLLPFIMLSDSFTEWAVSHSKGSTNPYVLFSDLADYELNLPSIEDQKVLADKLWAAYRLKEAYKRLLSATDEMVKSQFIEWFGSPVSNPKGWQVVPLKEASILVSDGPFGSNLKLCHYVNHGIRVIRLQNIGVGFFDDRDKAFISESHYNVLKKYTCKPGEVVIGTLGEPNLRACIVPDYIDTSINKADCIHVIPDETKLLPQFVCSYINCEETLYIATSQIHGTTRNRISGGQVSQLPIYLPQIELQKQFISVAEQADKSKFDGFKSQFIEIFGNPVSNDRNWDYECINSVAPESPAAHVENDQVWLLNLDMIESNTGNIIEKVVVPKSEVLSAQPFDEGNVLFSKLRPYLNKVVSPKNRGYATTELVPLRPNQNKLNRVFFTYLLRSDQFVQFANDISGGTKMPRMPLKELREFKCILPPICLQEKFAAIVSLADKSKYYEINET